MTELTTLTEQFQRDGFVVVPDVFSDEALATYGSAVDLAVARATAHDDRPLAERSRYEQSFRQCQYLWATDPEVRALSCHPKLARLAAELLGVDAVRMWHDQALYKEPGGRPTDPHQDHPYWPLAETAQITAWIPFDGSTASSGAMAYYPGSHRVGLDRFVNIFGRSDPDDIGADPALAGITPQVVEVPRGSVAFHHGLTAHFAQPNTTDSVRRVHTVIYLADGCRRGGMGPHPSVDFDGIEDGALVDGSFTPVLWPRRDDDLPAPPPDAAARLEARWLPYRAGKVDPLATSGDTGA